MVCIISMCHTLKCLQFIKNIIIQKNIIFLAHKLIWDILLSRKLEFCFFNNLFMIVSRVCVYILYVCMYDTCKFQFTCNNTFWNFYSYYFFKNNEWKPAKSIHATAQIFGCMAICLDSLHLSRLNSKFHYYTINLKAMINHWIRFWFLDKSLFTKVEI